MNECNQCGYMHPPLKPGEICPAASNSKIKIKEETGIDVSKLIDTLTTVLKSQLPKKQIKDQKKLESYVIINFQKILEDYKE